MPKIIFSTRSCVLALALAAGMASAPADRLLADTGTDVYGHPLGTDVQGNPNDKNAQGDRPEDAQGNTPHDIYGNSVGTTKK